MAETFRRSTRLSLLILALLLASPAAEAQRIHQPPRVGILLNGRPGPAMSGVLNTIREALQDLGHVEGQSFQFEVRWAEGRLDLQQRFISELVRLPVDVLVVGTTDAALDAVRATTTIPIVANAGALLEGGVVASLARPGGNVTGVTSMQADLAAKRLALLKEVLPKLSRVTALSPPYRQASIGEAYATQTKTAARSLGIELQLREVGGPSDLEDAFQAAARGRADAVILLASPFFGAHAKQVAELGLKHRLPTMSGQRTEFEAGVLMYYSPDFPDVWRRIAGYVHQILKGAKPAELPVQQPTKFRLMINLKTAAALGLVIPPSVLLRADEVIQ